MTFTLIIATADRSEPLATTLRGLERCVIPDSGLHVLVVDNGTDEGTRQVCGQRWAGLEVQYLRAARRGKTSALNEALTATSAEVLVFTDDDVEFDAQWLTELLRAVEQWPEHEMFGGRVVPIWPGGCMPRRLEGSAYLGPLYTLLDLGAEEGPRRGFHPFGPNMAVRRSVFERGVRFDETIGPGSATGVTMGDETAIARTLAARGGMAVYVPTSLVYHQVREEQLSLRWQLRRGRAYGRMLAYHETPIEGPRLLGAPRWLYRRFVTSVAAAGWNILAGNREQAFDRLMDAAVAVGRRRQRVEDGRARPG